MNPLLGRVGSGLLLSAAVATFASGCSTDTSALVAPTGAPPAVGVAVLSSASPLCADEDETSAALRASLTYALTVSGRAVAADLQRDPAQGWPGSDDLVVYRAGRFGLTLRRGDELRIASICRTWTYDVTGVDHAAPSSSADDLAVTWQGGTAHFALEDSIAAGD